MTKPTGDMSYFNVVCQGKACPNEPQKVGKSEQETSFTGLTPYTSYTFKVTAVKEYTQKGVPGVKLSTEVTQTCDTAQKGKSSHINLRTSFSLNISFSTLPMKT